MLPCSRATRGRRPIPLQPAARLARWWQLKRQSKTAAEQNSLYPIRGLARPTPTGRNKAEHTEALPRQNPRRNHWQCAHGEIYLHDEPERTGRKSRRSECPKSNRSTRIASKEAEPYWAPGEPAATAQGMGVPEDSARRKARKR